MASRRITQLLVAARPLLSRAVKPTTRSLIYQNQGALYSLTTSGIHTSTPRFNEHIFNVQDSDDFDARVVKSSTPVVIDFHATWCGPCKILGPRLEAMIGSKDGKVLMAKVDIDDMSELAIDHGVEAVPTVIAMKDGKVVDKFIGLKDDADLESFMNKLIGE